MVAHFIEGLTGRGLYKVCNAQKKGGHNVAKRKETLELENALIKHTREKRQYGCEEITIGFCNQGLGNEIVDFMTMDSKGVIKCYEIKVTLQDLKSNAKKSWYGHYNYLVISRTLYEQVQDWDLYIPKHIGVIVGNALESVRKCQRQEVPTDSEIMLKESLLRSMYWKMEKFKDAQSLEKQKKAQEKIREVTKEKDYYRDRALEAEKTIRRYERYRGLNTGQKIDLEQQAEEEKTLFYEKKNGGKANEDDSNY